MNISGVDLNLMVAFDALMSERSVTRAAERIGLSQSGMSNALARLRTLLDDQVLVRTGDGMMPTRKALAIAPQIHQALEQLGRALSPQPLFDARTSKQQFRVATVDYAELIFLPVLLDRLARDAPGIDLVISSLATGLDSDAMSAGRTDLALCPGGISEPLREQLLLHESFVCIVRKGHPTVKKRLTLKQFTELGHVLVSPKGQPGSHTDRQLAERGLSRRVAVVTPHFLVAPQAVAASDHISTVPQRIAKIFAAQLPLVLHKPPIEIPSFSMSMIWHSRAVHDPAQRWLRQLVSDLAETL